MGLKYGHGAIAASTSAVGHFYKRFATSTGNNDLTSAGFASSTPGIFIVSPSTVYAPAGVMIHRVTMSFIDTNIRPDRFAGQTASTAGVKVEVTTSTGGVLLDFLDGETIKNNGDWALLTGTDATVVPAAGDDALPIRWTIALSGVPLLLKQGHQLRVTVQDASSGITQWKAMAQGHYEVDRTL